MPKIYLSPAYHRFNPCAISGCDETTHNNLYLDELEVYLQKCGIQYKRGPRRVPMSNEDGTALMKQAVADSNAFSPDIHYVSHTNAANGQAKGYRPMIFPTSEKGKKIAECVMKYRREIYPGPIALYTRTDLYELKATKAPAFYEEHVFHDNYEDAKWFHDNLRNVARQTAKAFCEYFGIAFSDPYESDNKPEPTPTPTPEPQPEPTPTPTPEPSPVPDPKPTPDNDPVIIKYTAEDALKALRAAVGKDQLSDEEAKRLDADGDGRVTANDALLILKNSVGK